MSSPLACRRCGWKRRHAKGLCMACYQWERRHGEPRPYEVIAAAGQRAIDEANELEIAKYRYRLSG